MPLRRLLRPILVGGERRGACLAIFAYWIISISSGMFSTWIGSLSEYRFPHPLLTTTLHLLISLLTLTFATQAAKYLLQTIPARQLSQGKNSIPRQLLENLAGEMNLPRSTFISRLVDIRITPLALSTSLMTVLASLVEMRAGKITEMTFWNTARILPLLFTLLLSLLTSSSAEGVKSESLQKILAFFIFFIFLGGPTTGLEASGQGWLAGLAYSSLMTGWMTLLQSGMRGNDVESQPSILQHLTLTSILLSLPLLLSREIGAALKAGHFGFFTEIGFWGQELLMAWCGLAGLIVFWHLVKNLDLVSVCIVIVIKDLITPFFYNHLFDNPFPSSTETALSPAQQKYAIVVVGIFYVVNSKSSRKSIELVKLK